jgi:hypothetical protein
LILLVGLTFCSLVFAQSIPTLQDAIASGQVNGVFYGTGSSSGDSVTVEVSKGPKAASGPKEVSVPPGSRLDSADAGAQGMMILGIAGRVTGATTYAPADNIVVPATGTATYLLTAFCSEFHKDNPSESTRFTLRSPDPSLACIAKRSKDGGLSIDATQAAVWIYTDRLTFEAVNEKFSVSRTDWDRAQQVVRACGLGGR